MRKDMKGVRTRKRKYGKDIHRIWGKMGGSPILKSWAEAQKKKTLG